MFMLILLVLVVAGGFYFISAYNNLVGLKHEVSKCWSNIDILLKQRHDELPKLIETCKQYMKHEKETLEAIVTARSSVASARQSGNISALGEAESALRLGLGNLFAVVENYPDLKANETFQHLQQRITVLENSIADRRELYNDSVNINNVSIEQFPAVIVAQFFNFKAAVLLEFADHELEDANLKSFFD